MFCLILFFLVLLPLQCYNHFLLHLQELGKGKIIFFPRVAKSNRAVLPNCAWGVTTYRKTFLEGYVLFCFYKTVTSYQAVAEFWAVDVNKWCILWEMYSTCHLGTLDDGCEQQKIYLDTFHFTLRSKKSLLGWALLNLLWKKKTVFINIILNYNNKWLSPDLLLW